MVDVVSPLAAAVALTLVWFMGWDLQEEATLAWAQYVMVGVYAGIGVVLLAVLLRVKLRAGMRQHKVTVGKREETFHDHDMRELVSVLVEMIVAAGVLAVSFALYDYRLPLVAAAGALPLRVLNHELVWVHLYGALDRGLLERPWEERRTSLRDEFRLTMKEMQQMKSGGKGRRNKKAENLRKTQKGH